MSFLDAIKREPVAKPEIVSDLNRYIIEYSKEQERHDGWIHLSQLGVCQRALVFEVANAPMNIKGAGSIQLTFDVGTAVYELVQGYFQRMGNLEGWYKCPNGHKEYGISLKICKTCATIKCDICDKSIEIYL